MYNDEDMLALSGIQHFEFCRRQWALIHIEQQWEENFLTVAGELMHSRAHDESERERRGDVLVVRGLHVVSRKLGFTGQCDVVEFHKSEDGCALGDVEGYWKITPVEYKHGISKVNDMDRLQLCAQAVCLEEMFCCDIEYGDIYYGKTRRRERVNLNQDLRLKTEKYSEEMHSLYLRKYTPSVRQSKKCNACSLKNLCVPKIKSKSVKAYLDKSIEVEQCEDC